MLKGETAAARAERVRNGLAWPSTPKCGEGFHATMLFVGFHRCDPAFLTGMFEYSGCEQSDRRIVPGCCTCALAGI